MLYKNASFVIVGVWIVMLSVIIIVDLLTELFIIIIILLVPAVGLNITHVLAGVCLRVQLPTLRHVGNDRPRHVAWHVVTVDVQDGAGGLTAITLVSTLGPYDNVLLTITMLMLPVLA